VISTVLCHRFVNIG